MNNKELIEQVRKLCDSEFNSGNIGATLMRKIYALTDALEAAQKEIEHRGSMLEAISKSHATLVDSCDALTARAKKAEAKNRWIPVSERLPKESEYRNGDRYRSMDSNELVPLLVCCKDTEIPFRAFYDGKNWGDGCNKVDVICWMPLPAPMEETQNE